MKARFALAALLLLLSGAPPADADPWKKEHPGRGHGLYKRGPDLRGCRIERRWTSRGYHEVIDCTSRRWGPPPAQQLPPILHTQPPPGPRWGPVVGDPRGPYCREYTTLGDIGGRVEELWGTACLMPDGSWEFQ